MTFRVKDLMITVLPEHIQQAMELCGATASRFSCGATDPPSCGATDRPSCGATDPPSCGATDPPSCGSTDRPSCGATDPPSCGATDRPSCGATDPPSCGATDPPSCGATDPPSCGATDRPSCGATDPNFPGGFHDKGDPFTNPAVLRFQLEQILAGINAHEAQLKGGAQSRSVSSASFHELKAMETKLTEALAEVQAQRRQVEQQGH